MTSMSEKDEPTTLLSFSVIFTWFCKRNQLHINFFFFSICTNSCPNEEDHGGQNENQTDISTTWNVNSYTLDDWDNAVDKNLEQLIIPPSVPHKVMHRGRSTQRLAASSRQNHCSHCGHYQDTQNHTVPVLQAQPSCNHTNNLPNKLHHPQKMTQRCSSFLKSPDHHYK